MTSRTAWGVGLAALGGLALLIAMTPGTPLTRALQAQGPAQSGPASKACQPLAFGDPETEARRALAARDYRMFTITGFTIPSAPGLACADQRRFYEPGFSRGGTMVSDVPDVCGSYSFSNVPPDKQVAFNRIMGRDPGFVAATGCRALSDCAFDNQWAAEAARYGRVPVGRLPPPSTGCDGAKEQLYALVIRRDLPGARRVLARSPADWSRADEQGLIPLERALILAASGGDPRMVALLLPRVPRGRAPADAPIRSLERAVLAAAQNGRTGLDADRRRAVALLIAAGARMEYRDGNAATSLLSAVLGGSAASDASRAEWTRLLLARGADPNGPRCPAGAAGGLVRQGPAPLASATEDEDVFDLLVRAGANVRGHACPAIDRNPLLRNERSSPTARAFQYLDGLSEGFEERRRVAIRLLRMGGRVPTRDDNYRIPGPNVEALSIIVAEAQLSGRRDQVVNGYLHVVERRPEHARPAIVAALRRWRDCPHGAPRLLADRAELCGQ